MLMSREKSICLLRSLYREIRFLKNSKSAVKTPSVRQTQLWQKIMSLNRENDVDSATVDSGAVAKNLVQAGESYLNYMRSARKFEDLLKSQKGHGERSATDMAKLMGFSLPNEPRVSRKSPSSK